MIEELAYQFPMKGTQSFKTVMNLSFIIYKVLTVLLNVIQLYNQQLYADFKEYLTLEQQEFSSFNYFNFLNYFSFEYHNSLSNFLLEYYFNEEKIIIILHLKYFHYILILSILIDFYEMSFHYLCVIVILHCLYTFFHLFDILF